jgi:1-acyl-sn-glycerol-3-phosphate acyltransferase
MFKPFTFRPPRNNRFIIALAKRFLPLGQRLGPRVVAVEVNEEDLRRLKELKGQRVVLTPSHSGGEEPYIIFHLSKLLNDEFNYLAAKEAFEQAPPVFRFLQFLGVYSWLCQRVGIYSIVRGTPDRDSFRTTRRLLVEGRRWLVIFPEGESCGLSDAVMPFQQGAAQLAFWAYEDLAGTGEPHPIYFVPIAIKYVYMKDMGSEIDRSLVSLEDRLSLKPSPQTTLYNRLHRVGEEVLGIIEKEYNVQPVKGAAFDERIQNMKELIVSRVETALGISPRFDKSLLKRIRDLFNTIDHIVYSEPEGPEYEQQLHRQRQEKARELYNDLWRVLYFVALHDGYVRETLSAERFLDVLGRLEREVFGRIRCWGPRKAIVKIGEPLNLANYYHHYKADKRGALKNVPIELESSVRQMLTELSRLTKPIEPV